MSEAENIMAQLEEAESRAAALDMRLAIAEGSLEDAQAEIRRLKGVIKATEDRGVWLEKENARLVKKLLAMVDTRQDIVPD